MIGELPGAIQTTIEDRIRKRRGHLTIKELELSPDLVGMAQDLAEAMQTSPSEVIGKALLLLQVALDAEARGYEIGVVKKENKSNLEYKIAV
jgi:hypothetical protein